MGYGIFGQKITGIRDIKTPPNGASKLQKSIQTLIIFFVSAMAYALKKGKGKTAKVTSKYSRT